MKRDRPNRLVCEYVVAVFWGGFVDCGAPAVQAYSVRFPGGEWVRWPCCQAHVQALGEDLRMFPERTRPYDLRSIVGRALAQSQAEQDAA